MPIGILPFDATLSVALQPEVRGIHMSRMEEVITDLYNRQFDDPLSYATELAKMMVLRQEAGSGTVELSGRLPIQRRGSASGRISIDSMEITCRVECDRSKGTLEKVKRMIGVAVNHITACPCTQAYNQVLFNVSPDTCPLPTHSQRSQTRLTTSVHENAPCFDDLRICLEAALHVTQDLLKRQDEAEIVLKSHRHPQFAEDAVRETAREVVRRFGDWLPGSAAVIIESLSLESIHIHDVHCRLETTLAELCRLNALAIHHAKP